MTALPMDFSAVLSVLAHPVPLPVWDVMGARLDGEWMDVELAPREPIQAVVLMTSTEDLQILREGEDTRGGISLLTTADPYFPDQTTDPPETRQSYVEYQGRRYRVTGTGSLMGNTSMHVYHALRSVK